MSLVDSIKEKAKAEIVKIEDAAVREYLLLKASGVSLKVALIAAGVAFVLGFILG